MMCQTVERCAGKQGVSEDVGPLFKRTVAGDDHRPVLVALSQDLVEVLGTLRRDGLQAKVVQDEKIDG